MERKLTETIGEEKQIVEIDAQGAPVKDVLWNANEMQTESVRVLDPMVGTEIVLRHFFFKALPLPKGTPAPTKKELVSHYKRLIETTLWGDGLTIREDKPIEVHTRQKAKKISPALYGKMRDEGADFVILVLATPRNRQVVTDYVHQAV